MQIAIAIVSWFVGGVMALGLIRICGYQITKKS